MDPIFYIIAAIFVANAAWMWSLQSAVNNHRRHIVALTGTIVSINELIKNNITPVFKIIMENAEKIEKEKNEEEGV